MTSFDDVIGIETGAAPQSKVITPPAASASASAASVQLADVPLPTTTSGLRVSTSAIRRRACCRAGRSDVAGFHRCDREQQELRVAQVAPHRAGS